MCTSIGASPTLLKWLSTTDLNTPSLQIPFYQIKPRAYIIKDGEEDDRKK